MTIIFGPAGLGPVKEAISNLEKYHDLGLRACEIAFTYGAYIKNKEDAEAIGKKAKELRIKLSIHAHYWINLNSEEKEKIEQSKQRILECCKVGTWLGAECVVFHAGFYGGDKEKAFNNIKTAIIELQKECKERHYTPKLAPEIMGKVNVFGSVEEIERLAKETGCSFCIDFAHILAREKDYRFKEVMKRFGDYKHWHVHFSGIVYGDKGEKHHITTPEKEIGELIHNLPKNKDVTVINESPSPVADSVLGLKMYKDFH
ncbi:MAG: TIM barrel protein [Nanoarchaeota archaeon]|nr:TIM barrel protein [Nanoarchaeota archaeon]